jgi:hypothetical protein
MDKWIIKQKVYLSSTDRAKKHVPIKASVQSTSHTFCAIQYGVTISFKRENINSLRFEAKEPVNFL